MEPTNVTIKETNQTSEEQQKYIKELKRNFWVKCKEIRTEQRRIADYEALVGKLGSIHIDVKSSVLLPVVRDAKEFPLCFIDGYVYHTNEVFVPIGSSYYTKASNTEAVEFCHRRIEGIEENIIRLEDEKKTYLEKIVFIEESTLQPGQVEIIEEYPEDYEIPGSRRNKPRKTTTQCT